MKTKLFHLISLLLCVCFLLPACAGKPITIGETDLITQLDNVSAYASVTGEATELEGLPSFIGGKYRGAYPGRYDMVTHTFTNADAASFLSFLKSLEESGWTQYSNNIIQGRNLFATYIKDGKSVYTYYIDSTKRVTISASPYQNLEVRESDNQYETLCQPQLTQIKLKFELDGVGMSYLIRLSDGRFLIIDGGLNEADHYESKHLYSLMQAQNILPKITVAAWIITHPHGDHLGAAADFLQIYTKDDLDIQQMIFHFPTEEDLYDAEPTCLDTSNPSKYPAFMTSLETYWPDVKVTVPHTGQKYYFADATLEFLHTVEDYYPTSISALGTNTVNGSSTIFSMEIDGQKTLFLADCSQAQTASILRMWGSYLKADIMQVAHHGQRGASLELYQTIDPIVALFPADSAREEITRTFEASLWVWDNLGGKIKQVFHCGFVEATIPLPYTPAEGAEYLPRK